MEQSSLLNGKAVGFEEYDRATDSWTNLGTNKPTWLTAMSKENGEGGAIAESGKATITKADLKDRLTEYNKVLQTATEKGAAGNYYNLSMLMAVMLSRTLLTAT